VTTWGVVVAAGRGERFGRLKHVEMIGGLPMWVRARDCLLAGGVDGVVVVGDVPGGVPGGARRRDSVRLGVEALPEDAAHVLIHDAARPLTDPALTMRVSKRLALGDVDGVVPVLPVRDTLKRVANERVVETVDRAGLAIVQTPQGFVVDSLVAAHDASDDDASDDALLIERWGGSIATVPGDETNLKVTYPGDLKVAEALLS
jgi:2-C-methyl-D-erythritol 4-phosphate cytidylyltransferase